ncbi:MAG: hypothetical protein ACOX4I_00680 [Anaerovoracaceae bacterium]|jgi:hypothetical protein
MSTYDTKKVSVGKPKIGGAVYRAPVGTALPTDTTTELAEAYKCLGYISEDGMENEIKVESDDVKAWGGDTVLTPQKSKSETFKFTLIQVLDEDVLKNDIQRFECHRYANRWNYCTYQFGRSGERHICI